MWRINRWNGRNTLYVTVDETIHSIQNNVVDWMTVLSIEHTQSRSHENTKRWTLSCAKVEMFGTAFGESIYIYRYIVWHLIPKTNWHFKNENPQNTSFLCALVLAVTANGPEHSVCVRVCADAETNILAYIIVKQRNGEKLNGKSHPKTFLLHLTSSNGDKARRATFVHVLISTGIRWNWYGFPCGRF